MFGEKEFSDRPFDGSNAGRPRSATGSSSSSSGSTSSIPSATTATAGDDTHNRSAELNPNSSPIVLHAVVSDDLECIRWLACGTRFVIANKQEFTKRVLPRHFGGRGGETSKFTSFTRRLKRWNFTRVPSGPEMGAYFNPHFLQGRPELVKNLMYPMSKDKQALPATSGNKRLGKPAVSETHAIPNVRRRASTGSIVSSIPSKALPRSVTVTTRSRDISPTPVRAAMTTDEDGSTCSLLEMNTWLSSVVFVEDGGSLMSEYASEVTVQASAMSSLSHSLPASPFPNNIITEGSQGVASEAKALAMRPAELMRRHSVTTNPGVASTMCTPTTTTQLLGANNPKVDTSAASNTHVTSDNNVARMMENSTQPTTHTDSTTGGSADSSLNEFLLGIGINPFE